ncbi:glutathione S-transferase family protein [Vulcaniibacterium tengchongense]|nr:glutathione S-transferase family protein [Vulcaniibacterium tengchongense]
MEPILFYGVPEGCSFGSIVALEWSGHPYRLCRIEMPEVVAGEAYRRINPIGETPSLLAASGEVFSQSLAVLQHIARLTDDPRMGPRPGAPGFDRMVEMLAFLHTTFFGAFGPLWLAFEGAQGAEKEALQALGRKRVRNAHAQLETLLDGRDWLAGEGPTVADAYFVGIARWNEFHRVLDRREFPAVDALYRRLQDDPAVRFAHAVEDGLPARGAGGFRGEIALDAVLERLAVAA